MTKPCSSKLFVFLSTPSARRATRDAGKNPLAGVISIHALREEGDASPYPVIHVFIVFLSTPSARRATFPFRESNPEKFYFYPRPPRGGRLGDQRSTN